ncbi:hypothetical protein DL769_004930 [Monosporascus sp. CRB-8-3]|nr:hypothetical protein DL769_004930 [Monosporascus sp. CRB-8-3]
MLGVRVVRTAALGQVGRPVNQRYGDHRGGKIDAMDASQKRKKEERDKEECSDDPGDERSEHSAEATQEPDPPSPDIWTPTGDNPPLGVILDQFLDAANAFPFDNDLEQPTNYFQRLHKFLQEDKGNDLIVKFLTREDAWSGTIWTETKVEKFLVWLAGRKPTILKKIGKRGVPPVISALERNRGGFIRAIINREELRSALEEEGIHSGRWLHAAIEAQSPFLYELVELRKSDDLFAAVDDNNNALHALVEVVGEEVSKERLEQVVKALATGTERRGLDDADSDDSDEEEDGFQEEQHGQTRAPLRSRLRLMKMMMSSKSRLRLLQQVNNLGHTPYQLREITLEDHKDVQAVLEMEADEVRHQLSKSARRPTKSEIDAAVRDAKDAALRKVIVADPIANYIRKFCIRKLEKAEDTVKALYKSGSERHIDFDLAGYPGTSISQDFLNKLAKHLQFESILKYVALPNLFVEPSKFAAHKASVESNGLPSGLNTDLRAIFEWFRVNGVRRIIKITVVDYGDKCHRDSVIKEALAGFKVEFWTWKKVDICSEAIASSSRTVKEISLYWTGNYAVMMGWASREGFSDEKRFPKLKKIHLFVKEGYDKLEILKRQTNRFKRQMLLRNQDVEEAEDENSNLVSEANGQDDPISVCSEGENKKRRIDVVIVFDNEEFNTARDFRSGEGGLEVNPWIQAINSFCTFLQNKKNPNPVKIAIIDDGIDATWPDIHGRIVKGKSFYPYPGSEFFKAYYVPSGKHGTLMATLICKSCPRPQLYIARMEERRTEDDIALFTTDSAIKAIEWAISCEVDIISMSWTIEGRSRDSRDVLAFDNILSKAIKKGILLFGSASDHGPNRDELTYPGGFKECIRIGAASDDGVPLPWVNELDVNYFLPGKRIPFRSPDKDSYFYKTGSSFATACAAGLAGTLLYCDRVLGGKYGLDEKDDKSGKMMKVLDRLCTAGSKFVDVRKNLEEAFVQKLDDRGVDPSLRPPPPWDGDTLQALDDFMRSITLH